MQMRKMLALLTAFTCAAALLTGCAGTTETKDDSGTVADNGATDADKDTEGVHEVIRMQAPFRTMGNFIDIVHEKYPEINLEAVPYSGQNYIAYVKAQLNSGDLPGRMPII